MTQTSSSRPALPDTPPEPPAEQAGDRPFALLRTVMPLALLASIFFVLVRSSATTLTNTDTYFHLRFGSEFLSGSWSLWHPGSVSTFATAHWLPTQWLTEVVMAKLDAWFGLAGVAWWSGLQETLLAVSLYVVARRWAGSFTTVVLMIVAFVAMNIGLSARPQVLSYVFVVLVVGAWLRTRDDGRLRWWLVPLTWLWAMVHGMWPLAIGFGAVAVLGLALDRRLPRATLARGALLVVASAIAAALTPVGPGLYGAVTGVGARASYFSEWQAPVYALRYPATDALAVLLVVAAVAMLRTGRRTWFDILFLLVAAACAVSSWRTVPVSACVLVPLLAVWTAGLWRRRPDPIGRRETGVVWLMAAVALIGLAVAVPSTSDRPMAEPSWLPAAVTALPSGTKVVDDWGWGGYLMWRYPRLDLLGHGYGDTFTVAELARNTDIVALAPGWDTELRATGCRIALLRPQAALTYALEHQEGWTVLHRSDTLVELQAPAGWAASS